MAQGGKLAIAAAFPGAAAMGAGLAMLAVVLVFNEAEFGRRFLEKYPPDMTAQGLFRTLVCLLSGGLVAIGLNAVAGKSSRAVTDAVLGERALLGVGLAGLLIMTFTAGILLVAPRALAPLVSELGVIGVAQEAALALALAFVAAAGLLSRRSSGLLARVVFGGLAVSLFLLLMEELSWGQHIVGWTSPELFAGNIQSETNLHNFYTNRFELLYYGGAILALVVVPFAWPQDPSVLLRPLSQFIPPRGFALAALPVAAYLYEIWNIVPMQAGFFLALAIGILAASARGKTGQGLARLALVSVAAMIACQAIFMAEGDRLAISYEIEEMRETGIIWMVLVYAVWLFASTRRGLAGSRMWLPGFE